MFDKPLKQRANTEYGRQKLKRIDGFPQQTAIRIAALSERVLTVQKQRKHWIIIDINHRKGGNKTTNAKKSIWLFSGVTEMRRTRKNGYGHSDSEYDVRYGFEEQCLDREQAYIDTENAVRERYGSYSSGYGEDDFSDSYICA